MKKLIVACATCLVLCSSMIAINSKKANAAVSNTAVQTSVSAGVDNSTEINYWVDSLYTKMDLAAVNLSQDVFFEACKGYEYMLSQNSLIKRGIITICDFSQSSKEKRLYVLDLNQAKVLFNTYVSHGHNSGDDYATTFSNSNSSHKSCLGFLRTAETYIGDNGYSLRLDGMENGFNDHARERAIVMHGSNYVNGQRASGGKMMGRSYGCPAVPASEVKNIINCIKGGSCFFNYYPDKYYTQASKILNANFTWPVTQVIQLASVKISDSLLKLPVRIDPVN
jgi:hypothetical protein